MTVMLVAGIGFVNYVLLRIYGNRGLYYTALLGGLVNSPATVAELSTKLAQEGALVSLAVPIVLLTVIAMFVRNLIILAIFAPSAAPLLFGPCWQWPPEPRTSPGRGATRPFAPRGS